MTILSRYVMHSLTVLIVLYAFVPARGNQPVPTNLPHPDSSPPTSNKPVKVYILAGQSNMVGFGTLTGGQQPYSTLYLSADPGFRPGRMPVGDAGLLPHGVYQSASGVDKGAKAFIYPGEYNADRDDSTAEPIDETTVALGSSSEQLPSVQGPHTVVVRAFLEVPMTGRYEAYVGFEDSCDATAVLAGEQVYHKPVGGQATTKAVTLQAGKRYPITITYRRGGSAAFWMKRVDLQPRGSLEALVNEGRFPWMVDDSGEWTSRNDVLYHDAFLGDGSSKPLSPTANGRYFGPELGFGYVMGTFHDEPVLIIKSCTGNRSLAWDFLPPGSERYEVDGMMYAGYKDTQSKWPKEQGEPKPGGWYAGKQYDESTKAIRRVLDNFDEHFPQFKDQGYEIAGFVWWQGHKDQNDVHASRYEHNMVNLIKAWRSEFNAPDAKWAIATIAFNGWKLGGAGKKVAEAQLAVSGDSGRYPEFKGNVKTIEARGFWRNVGESPSGTGYHYNHNAETYMLTGDALGRAMVEMMGGKVEPGPVPHRPAPVPDKPVEEMTLAEQGRLLFTDAFIWTWSRDSREPTPEQLKAMQPAMKPFILANAIPEFVAEAPGVPGHLRRGVQLTQLVSNDPPEKPVGTMTGQLDELISYFNLAGIHDYDWKPFGPDMKNGKWWYFSFDPPEKLDMGKSGRYRKITLPKSMEDWNTKAFDPAAAGWSQGHAPFGQNNGKLAPLKGNCTNPQCGCSITPRTLWEKEVLLMQQTFELPELRDDCRYRLVIGGSGHAFSGEGFAVYVNGELFDQADSGFFKRGGSRGKIIWNDFLPEFQGGKVTIAVKAFLRTTHWVDRPAPPRGHISVWIEQAQLPEVVTRAFGKSDK